MDGPTGKAGDAPLDTPSVARMYDYWLGGFHHFAVDRQMAEELTALYPALPQVAWANRAALRRVVTFLAEQGIDQFLDIGSGIPTVGNVHEVAQRINPAARVVYVDNDPVAVEHSRAILADNSLATVVEADARLPEALFAHPEVQRLLDCDRPIAVLVLALLHFIPDDAEAERIVRTLRDALAPGSYLAISHATRGYLPDETTGQIERAYTRISTGGKYRPPAVIARFFDGLTLIAPGLVYAPLWRPETPDDPFLDRPEESVNLVGVGHVPKRAGE
ncbi:MAG: SAM-dependent methyltransferase [Chloroflexota bacterium]|nr:SAM-dependent methyltransferase [Chloroflexota bacterium]